MDILVKSNSSILSFKTETRNHVNRTDGREALQRREIESTVSKYSSYIIVV